MEAKITDEQIMEQTGAPMVLSGHRRLAEFAFKAGMEYMREQDPEKWDNLEAMLESKRQKGRKEAQELRCVSREWGINKGRREAVEFIKNRRNSCRLNTEQIDCRLCLSELLQALSGKPISRKRG